MKSFIVGLLALGLVGCAGYNIPDIMFEDKESGVRIETTKEGKICVDDGDTKSGCIQLNKEEVVKEPVVE